jgi:putative ATP-dependent endonuclease of OLD family
MKIEKVIVEGFRSFGERCELDLGSMTSLVGGNGAGKTSFLLALNRFFGTTQKDRTIINEDFFISAGQSLDDIPERRFTIEVKIIFPELLQGLENLDAVAECFRNMTADNTGVPYCRMRMEAVYTRDIYGEGDIKPSFYWVRDPYGTQYPEGEEEKKSDLSIHDRQRIKVIYTPASRDPQSQFQEFSGSLIGRFVNSIKWQTSPETTLKTAVDTVKDTLSTEAGVRVINQIVTDKWSALSPATKISNPKLSFIDDDLKKMLRTVSMNFDQGAGRRNSNIRELSDGERSLFYFSLLQSALNLKDSFILSHVMQVGANNYDIRTSFDEEKLQFPNLTILAIEEPENHLSPHHFGHLVESFKSLGKSSSSQVIFSSHSPSMISRVNPEDIRYFRIKDNKTVINKIILPVNEAQALTYIKEAVRAYPELYFSKIIVLGEGDSEEIVFRKLFEAKGLPLDRSMISVVPLGGRFVNHFWRLLKDLNIPYVTLLDLDLGKSGAGWGRIKDCIMQLLNLGHSLVEIGNETAVLSMTELQNMHTCSFARHEDYVKMEFWIRILETKFDVFFSRKLDLDLMLLDSFFEEYVGTIIMPARGPNQLPPPEDATYLQKVKDLKLMVLNDADSTVEYEPIKLNYYKYFFMSKGKPLTHALALSNISNEVFIRRCPEVLKSIGARVAEMLRPQNANTPPTEGGHNQDGDAQNHHDYEYDDHDPDGDDPDSDDGCDYDD